METLSSDIVSWLHSSWKYGNYLSKDGAALIPVSHSTGVYGRN